MKLRNLVKLIKEEKSKYDMNFINGGFSDGVEIKYDAQTAPNSINISISIYGGGAASNTAFQVTPELASNPEFIAAVKAQLSTVMMRLLRKLDQDAMVYAKSIISKNTAQFQGGAKEQQPQQPAPQQKQAPTPQPTESSRYKLSNMLKENTYTDEEILDFASEIGLNGSYFAKFISTHNIDADKLLDYYNSKKVKAIDIVTAVSGTPNNKYAKAMAKLFSKQDSSKNWWERPNVILKNTEYPDITTEFRIMDPTHIEMFMIQNGKRYGTRGNVLHIGQIRGKDYAADIENWIQTGDASPFKTKKYNDL